MGESALILLPTKFMLIVVQILLLVVVLGQKQYHVELEVGDGGSDFNKEAEKTLVGLTIAWMCTCFVEFFMMLVGSSVPHMFA